VNLQSSTLGNKSKLAPEVGVESKTEISSLGIYTLMMRASPPTRNSIERPILSTSVSGSSVVCLEIKCTIVLNRFLESDSLDHLRVTEHLTRVETFKVLSIPDSFARAHLLISIDFHSYTCVEIVPPIVDPLRDCQITWAPIRLV
jgi:hypothetical protein